MKEPIISEETQAELDYTMRKGYPSRFNGDMAAELDSLIRSLKPQRNPDTVLASILHPQGHLSRWMADQCDMENAGDRLAMEQHRAVIAALKEGLHLAVLKNSEDIAVRIIAALKAAEGE